MKASDVTHKAPANPGITSSHRVSTLWFAAGATTGAVTGALLAVLYIASAVGWLSEGRTPASGGLLLAVGTVAGGIIGGTAIGIQRRCSLPRFAAPLIALALLVLSGAMAWVLSAVLDRTGSFQYGLVVASPFAVIAIAAATTIVTALKSALWLRVAVIAGTLIAVALLISLATSR